MAETRKGTCKDCSAEYQIPASFTHDKAKCRECGGVVEIEPAAGAAAAPPVPAAEPPAKEAAGEKPMTMKEKILARKKAEAEAAAAAKAAEPAPKKKAAPARKKPAAAKAGGAKAGKKAGGRKAAGAKGKGRRGRGGDDAEEGGRKGRRGAAKQEKKTPVGGLIAIAVLVIGGGAGWYFTMGPGAGDDTPENTTVATNDNTTETDGTEGADITPVDPETATDEGTEDPVVTDQAPADEGTSDEGAGDEAATPEAPQPVEKTYDPMSVTYDDFELFDKFLGTTDEQWTEIQELVETYADMDAGARQGRAGRSLEEFGFRAIPAMVNKMRTFDLGTDLGQRRGDMFQRTMTSLMNGINAGWESEKGEDGNPVPRVHKYNRSVVRVYLTTWTSIVNDPTAWIATAKLTQEKYVDQLEEYSKVLIEAGVTDGEYADRILGLDGDFDDEDLGLDDF